MIDELGPARGMRREDTEEEIAGRVVPDPNRWLEACEDPKVVQWQAEHDARAERVLRTLDPGGRWRERLWALSSGTHRSLPRARGGSVFFLERAAGEDRARLCVQHANDTTVRTLVAPTQLHGVAPSIGAFWPSPSGKRVVVQVHQHNRDDAELHVFDVEQGQFVEPPLSGGGHTTLVFCPGELTFLYVHQPSNGGDRFGRATVRAHRLGVSPDADEVVFGPTGDSRTRLELRGGDSGRYAVLLVHHGFDRNDVFVAELVEGGCAPFEPLLVGERACNDAFEHAERIVVRTDLDADRGRVRATRLPLENPPTWEEVLGETRDPLCTVRSCGRLLCLEYLEDAASRIELRSLGGELVRTISCTEPVRASFDEAGCSDALYVGMEGFVSPRRIVSIDDQGSSLVWFRTDVAWNADRYVVERMFAHARDGTKIPYFVVRSRRGGERENIPTLLEGYGGFGVSFTPFFSPAVAAWLERGGQYVFACTRGGGEYGAAWHADGRGRRKENVFSDFIAVAEDMVGSGVATPSRLGIAGESNGGLLIAVVLNRRPELFGAALAQVPITDMIGFARYETYCLPEYGSPSDPADLDVLLSYCPYRNVRPHGRFPPLLVTMVPGDERAHPMHARKWVAQLERTQRDAEILLRVHEGSGHRGPAELSRRVGFIAETYAFFWHHLGGGDLLP